MDNNRAESSDAQGMRDDCSIAVIIPVYNRGRTIRKTLDSVSDQILTPSELIVVDDGSTDALETTFNEWLHDARPPFPAQLLRQPNLGAAAARNTGISSANNARYYAFLDSDDTWPTDFLERTLPLLKANPDAVAVTVDRLQHDYLLNRLHLDHLDVLQTNATVWMFQHGTWFGSATLFRADIVRELGGFNENYPTAHDMHLFLRISLRGQWLHAPGNPVTYHLGAAKANGEYDHLRFRFDDYWKQWAIILEDFLEHCGGRDVVPPEIYNARLARHWKQAGKQAAQAGKYRLAQQHFRQSLKYKSSVKTRYRLFKSVMLEFYSRVGSITLSTFV